MSRSTVRTSPDLSAPILMTMSTSRAPSKITRCVSKMLDVRRRRARAENRRRSRRRRRVRAAAPQRSRPTPGSRRPWRTRIPPLRGTASRCRRAWHPASAACGRSTPATLPAGAAAHEGPAERRPRRARPAAASDSNPPAPSGRRSATSGGRRWAASTSSATMAIRRARSTDPYQINTGHIRTRLRGAGSSGAGGCTALRASACSARCQRSFTRRRRSSSVAPSARTFAPLCSRA